MAEARPTNPVSLRDAERLARAIRRLLLGGGYPNPDRAGCPGPEALKRLAERRVDVAEAKNWVLHLGCCSPCFIEYTALREKGVTRKRLEYAFAFAATAAFIVVGGWLWRTHRFPGLGGKPNVATVLPVTLNLENRGVYRGVQPPSTPSGPVYLPRGRLDLTVLLPLGSEAGNYGVLIGAKAGKLLLEAKGPAVIRKDGVTVLKVMLDTSKLKRGMYILGIGEIGNEPYTYPLAIK